MSYRLNPPIKAELICIEESRTICDSLKRHMASREELYSGQYDANVLSVSKRYECNKFKVFLPSFVVNCRHSTLSIRF